MHEVKLPDELLQRARERRGRQRAFEDIDPKRTALLVVDMQNYFVEEGAPAEVPTARGIVPNINRLADTLRHAGGKVVWIYTTFPDPDDERAWIYLDYFVPAEKKDYLGSCLKDDHNFHEIWPKLYPKDGDLWVEKDRFSAFIQGASDIADQLRAHDIDTVLVVGTLTNVCCESTARDAMMTNFRPIMIDDANAARTDQDHLNGLSTVAQVFGDVMSTDEIIDILHGEDSAQAAE